MDLSFLPEKGKPFSIEIGYFDTVLEIKEKIQKDKGIPVSKQILIFRGKVLHDELNVQDSDICHWSQINIIEAFDPEEHDRTPTTTTTHNIIEADDELSILPSKKIQLLLKISTPQPNIELEMNVNDIIRSLKKKIHEIEGFPISRLIIHAGDDELHDHQTLFNCGLLDHSEIDVRIRPSSSTTSAEPSGNTSGSKKLNELNVHYSEILGQSHINLIVASDLEKYNSITNTTTDNNVEADDGLSILPSKKIKLVIKMPTPKPVIALEMDVNDNIINLKKKIHEMEGFPISRLIIHAGGVQLHDLRTLDDCKLLDHSEIDVSVWPFSSTTSAGTQVDQGIVDYGFDNVWN